MHLVSFIYAAYLTSAKTTGFPFLVMNGNKVNFFPYA